MDNEFWTRVINSSANLVIAGVGVIQIVLLYLTFKIGSNFLSDHRAKIKEERRVQLVIDLKTDLYLLRRLSIQYYRKPKEIMTAEGLQNEGALIQVTTFISQFIENMDTKGLEISQIRSEIKAKLDLLAKPDLIKEFEVFSKKYSFFDYKYLNFRSHLESFSKDVFEDFLLKEFEKIPIDFNSSKYTELRISNKAFFNLQELLTAEFNK